MNVLRVSVIRSDRGDPLDGDPLYWSNADGWGSLSTADLVVRDDDWWKLPVGGSWQRLDDAIAEGNVVAWRRGKAEGIAGEDA